MRMLSKSDDVDTFRFAQMYDKDEMKEITDFVHKNHRAMEDGKERTIILSNGREVNLKR